jgi:hypothetical protein
LLGFFSERDSHPRRAAGKPHITADTQEMIENMSKQLKIFQEMFTESWSDFSICWRSTELSRSLLNVYLLHLTHLSSTIDSVAQEASDDEDDIDAHQTSFIEQVPSIRDLCMLIATADGVLQFEQLLLETDVSVGVARRILEKRADLKSRAFNDLKKTAEKKCIEAVRAL